MNIAQHVHEAEARIRLYIRETPLDYSLALSHMTGADVFLKLENLQHTGSFKVRGALNKLLALTSEQRAPGVVAASSGNHGAALAFGLRTLGAQGIVFAPEHASPTKVDAIRRYGADVQFHGTDGVVTEIYARQYAEERGMTYISPYNDPQVIVGQGTIGVELARQQADIDAVFVSIGGGGLISGIAGYLKTSAAMRPTIIGCSPANDAAMIASIRAGAIIEAPALPTISDGTAGGLEPGAITFDLCRALVDDYVLVTEEEIRSAMRLFMETSHMLLEGAAGVALAAFLKQQQAFVGKRVVIVICGANISLDVLRGVV
jgi:threonine dehydratase